MPHVATRTSRLSRYQQVGRILLRYGFAQLVSQPPFNKLPGLSRVLGREGAAELQWTRYERIRLALAELGPTFVKLGQVAASRPDLLPPELLAELEKLQDEVPPMPQAEFEAVMAAAFGSSWNEIFFELDPVPIAAASIAQVHRARLHSGERVALKVQRKGIRALIEADVAIMFTLAELIEHLLPPDFYARPTEVVRIFRQQIRKELDFELERVHMEQFRQFFARDKGVYIPRTWADYSRPTVLCMEFVEGIRLSEVEALRECGIDPRRLARRGIQLYFRQFFEFGRYHADPHPGNILVQPDGTICLLDFGQVGRLTLYDQELLGELFVAAIQLDARALRQALERYSMVESGEGGAQLEYEINDLIATYADLPIEQVDFRELAARIFELVYRFRLRLPANLLMLAKTLVQAEGMGLRLDPSFHLLQDLQPWALELASRRYGPGAMVKRLGKGLLDMMRLSARLPRYVEELLEKANAGRLRIEFEHKGLDAFYRELDLVANRLVLALLIAALILGSSVVVLARIPPFINHVSAIGLAGFILSGILALWLLLNILRKGRY